MIKKKETQLREELSCYFPEKVWQECFITEWNKMNEAIIKLYNTIDVTQKLDETRLINDFKNIIIQTKDNIKNTMKKQNQIKQNQKQKSFVKTNQTQTPTFHFNRENPQETLKKVLPYMQE